MNEINLISESCMKKDILPIIRNVRGQYFLSKGEILFRRSKAMMKKSLLENLLGEKLYFVFKCLNNNQYLVSLKKKDKGEIIAAFFIDIEYNSFENRTEREILKYNKKADKPKKRKGKGKQK